MRSSQKPASLAELLGKETNAFSVKDLPKLLGEKLPDLPRNRIGKFRLTNALKLRFGPGFRNIPGIDSILKEFDEEMRIESVIKQNEESKSGNSN